MAGLNPGPCCCTASGAPCGSVCFNFTDRCGNGLAGITVTLTDSAAQVTSCTTNSAGHCCCTVTAAGTATYTYSAVTCYAAGSGSVVATCPGTVSKSISPTDTSNPKPGCDPNDIYIPCCGCVSCNRQPYFVCKTLTATLSGGTVGCDGAWTVTLNYSAGWGGNNPASPPTPPWFTRWYSGCQSTSGAKYECYYSASYTCKDPTFGTCPGITPFPVLGLLSNPQYPSFDVTLEVGNANDGNGCYLQVTYKNYYAATCSDVPLPSCGTGPNGEAGVLAGVNPLTTDSLANQIALSCTRGGSSGPCPYPSAGQTSVVTSCNSKSWNTKLYLPFPSGFCGPTNLTIGSAGPSGGSSLNIHE